MTKYLLPVLVLLILGAGCGRTPNVGVIQIPVATAPAAAVAGEKIPATVTIQFFGDIMLERNVARNMGQRGLDYIFEHSASSSGVGANGRSPLPGDANLTVANLEGPFAPRRIPTSKSIAFRFDQKFAAELKQYGIGAVSLANNHSYDMGAKNVAFTRKTLAQAGIGYFGDELQEGPELTWYWSETAPPVPSFVKEGKTASLASTEERAGGEVSSTVAFIGLHNTYHQPDLTKVAAALADAHTKAKYVIVVAHWGQEYKKHSNKKQEELAHWLIDHGADAVIGAHPHVVEEMELYKGQPIFYSLGNFIFDQYFSSSTQDGLSVGLTLEDGGVKSIYLFPFYSTKSQVQLMSGERRDNFIKWFKESSRLGDKKIEDGRIEL